MITLSVSSTSIIAGASVILYVTNATPGWGVHFVSITDGYTIIGTMIIADSSGNGQLTYIPPHTQTIYAYSDAGGGNSNQVTITVEPICNIPTVNFTLS